MKQLFALLKLFSVVSNDLSLSLVAVAITLALAIAVAITVVEKILVNSLFVVLLDKLVNNESNCRSSSGTSNGDSDDLTVVSLFLE